MDSHKESKDLKNEIIQMEIKMKIIDEIRCTKDENIEFEKLIKENKLLPEDVYRSNIDGYFYRIGKSNLSDSEIIKLIHYRQISYIKTIKNILAFFAFLVSIIGFFTLIPFLVGSYF